MNTKRSVLSGLFWRFGERVGAQLINLVISIVLARLLSPTDYGSIAMVNVFISFADVLVVSGFGSSLIQKKDADNLDFSTVFFFQMFLSVVLYAIIFVSAPYIANYYGSEYDILGPVLRVLGLRLLLTGINTVQSAYVSKTMQFRKFFFATLVGTVISAVISIILAYKGFGIWSLVAQYLINSGIDTIFLWITVKWRPEFKFSFKRLKQLFSFGWKLLLSAVIDTGYNQLRSLVIGKMYSASDLAYFTKGRQFPNLIVVNVNSSIDTVLFPAMTTVQDKVESIRSMTRRAIRTSSYVMCPLMLGFAALAEPFVSLVLTDKWLPCVPYIRIYCITYMFMPMQTANLQAIKAMGRSDLFLKLEIIKKVVGITALVISVRYGVFWIAMTMLITTFLSTIINSFPNIKLLKYNYFQQIKDLVPSIILSVVMAVPVYFLGKLQINLILLLGIQVLVGAVIYIGLSVLFKYEQFYYLLNTVKELLRKNGKKA